MAFDAFMQVNGIPGESSDAKHSEWCELMSFSSGVSQPSSGSASTGGSRASERCEHADFVVTKSIDKMSPKLALACCNGTHISKVLIELCRATGDKQPYMVYELDDCIVSNITDSGNTTGNLPVESVSFNYGKIVWTYTETDHKTGKSKGNVTSNWSLEENSGG